MLRRKNLWRISMLVGAFLVLGSIGFATFAEISRAQSGNKKATLSDAERLADWIAPAGSVTTEDSTPGNGVEALRFASLFPGSLVNPRYWSDPAWAGAEPFGGPQLPEGYVATAGPGLGLTPGSSGQALRIRIPSIGLDEAVEELELVLDEDDPHYEQPVNIVGHILGTVNPGENGNGWYFGHQSSFGSSEGAVFRRIPEIFELFRKDPVFVYLDTADHSYAYKVFGTDVVDRENLRLSSINESVVTLVTSWPPQVFDQRFLVFAELVGIR